LSFLCWGPQDQQGLRYSQSELVVEPRCEQRAELPVMSSSFGTYEPSDAILSAMQARLGAKNLAAAGYAAEAERKGEPLRPQHSEVVGGFATTAAPGFKMRGGLRDTPLVVVDKEPPPVSNELFQGGGGMTFGVKEVEDYVPSPKAAGPADDEGMNMNFGAGIGGIFSVGASSPKKAPEASTSPSRGGGGSAPSAPPKQKVSRTPSHGPDKASLRGPSPLAAKVKPDGPAKKRQAAGEFSQPSAGAPNSSRSGHGTPAHATGAYGAAPLESSRPSTASRLGPGRPPSAPPSASRQEPSSDGRSEMMDAADQALQRAMAQAAAGLPRMEELGYAEGSPEPAPIMAKLPSAVTVAGVPVATQGDMVYLGGGLYASAAPAPAPKKKPSSTMPGRTRPPQGRRPVGSAVRSASAHLMGPGAGRGDESPTPSRAQSDGELGLGHLNLEKGHQQNSARGSQAGSVAGSVPPGPRAWRPSGVQKLPPAKLEPPGYAHKMPRLTPEEAGMLPGTHAEERARDRNSKAKETVDLFGQKGVLHQLREMDRDDYYDYPMGPINGPPQNITRRQEERKAAKEAKIQQILEERAIRLATEAAVSAQKRQHYASLARNASAPELGSQELEKQKMRVKCKMELMDFFNGYGKAVNKLTKQQQKVLQAQLQGSSQAPDDTFDEFEEERPSVSNRLQQVNDMCNKVFEDPT